MLTTADKLAIHIRDDWRCRYCGCQCGHAEGPRMATVDHVVSRADGGDDRPDNLVTACFNCNQAKADALPQDFMRAKMPNAGKKHRRKVSTSDARIAAERAARKCRERARLTGVVR